MPLNGGITYTVILAYEDRQVRQTAELALILRRQRLQFSYKQKGSCRFPSLFQYVFRRGQGRSGLNLRRQHWATATRTAPGRIEVALERPLQRSAVVAKVSKEDMSDGGTDELKWVLVLRIVKDDKRIDTIYQPVETLHIRHGTRAQPTCTKADSDMLLC